MSNNYVIPDDLINFHGHLCPGLAIGYRAVLLANELGFSKSEDEELIAIVENNSCSVDAIQYMLSCTFGKGNLFFKDYGKQVFTIVKRDSLKAVRISLKKDARKPSFTREEFLNFLLNTSSEEIFEKKKFLFDKSSLPSKAIIHTSIICDECGEPTMETRIKKFNDKNLCIPCYNTSSRL